jgi:hypothetical protein
MLGDLISRAFDGSATAVMLSLFDTVEVDTDDLKQLRRLINQRIEDES